jgi:hypothetical protein
MNQTEGTHIMTYRNKSFIRSTLLALTLGIVAPLAAQAHPVSYRPSLTVPALFVVGREGGNIRPFTVAIAADGTVTTTGAIQPSNSHVKLGSDTLKGLLKLARAERFFALPDTITGAGVLPDVASLYIAIHTGNTSKTVREHGGHSAAFSQLYAVLMAAAGTCDGFAQVC